MTPVHVTEYEVTESHGDFHVSPNRLYRGRSPEFPSFEYAAMAVKARKESMPPRFRTLMVYIYRSASTGRLLGSE